jgi:hypothetical protein
VAAQLAPVWSNTGVEEKLQAIAIAISRTIANSITLLYYSERV